MWSIYTLYPVLYVNNNLLESQNLYCRGLFQGSKMTVIPHFLLNTGIAGLLAVKNWISFAVFSSLLQMPRVVHFNWGK